MMGRRAGACGRRRGSQKTGLDARLKCGAVGGGAGWVPSPPPRESGQGGGSLCRMSLCCRRRGEETTEKCDGPTPDCDQPNTGGCGIVARSNSHNKLTAARRRRMIPYRQGEFIPSSFIDSLFSKVPPSPNQLSISGRADLARRVGTCPPRIADPGQTSSPPRLTG